MITTNVISITKTSRVSRFACKLMAGNQLKLRDVITEVSVQTLTVPEKWSAQLQNINTEEDYKKIQK